jgi:hypothetical protein
VPHITSDDIASQDAWYCSADCEGKSKRADEVDRRVRDRQERVAKLRKIGQSGRNKLQKILRRMGAK